MLCLAAVHHSTRWEPSDLDGFLASANFMGAANLVSSGRMKLSASIWLLPKQTFYRTCLKQLRTKDYALTCLQHCLECS